MFYKKTSLWLVSLITITLATFGSQKTGVADELDLNIEINETTTDIFLDVQRYSTVGQKYIVNIYRPSTVVLPEMKWPTSDRVVSSGYGHRISCNSCSTFHKGADFTPGYGEPVYAAMDGIVSKIENRGEYGLYIIIEHIAVINTTSERWETVYAHLKEDSIPHKISVGSIVEAGTIIGAVGATGLITGPHLHFELRVESEKVDPIKYLKMYANQ